VQAASTLFEDCAPEKHRASQGNQSKKGAQKIIPPIHERVLQPDVKDRDVFLQAYTPAHTLAPALLSPANDEIRMTNDEIMTKSDLLNTHRPRFVI
jgi:hypothetical protein